MIVLLANSNLKHSVLSFVPIQNLFVDMSKRWHGIVGNSIVIMMILCAVSPYIEIIVEVLLVYIGRWADNRFRDYTKSTKCKTIYQYANLYAGPEYLIENRYNPIIV